MNNKSILLLLLFLILIMGSYADMITKYFETNVTLIISPWDQEVNISCGSNCSITYLKTNYNISLNTEDLNWDYLNLNNQSQSAQYKIRLARSFDTNYTNTTSELLAIKAVSYFGECGVFTCKEASQNCNMEKEILRTELFACQTENLSVDTALDKYSQCMSDLSNERSKVGNMIAKESCDISIKDESNNGKLLGIGIGIIGLLIINWLRTRKKPSPTEARFGSRGYPEGAVNIEKIMAEDKIMDEKAKIEELLKKRS